MQPISQPLEESFVFTVATEDDRIRFAPSYFARAAAKAAALYNTAVYVSLRGETLRFFGVGIPKGVPCKEINTVIGLHWFVFASPSVVTALALHHRNSHEGHFANDVAAKMLLEIGTEIFNTQMQPEDTVSTCTAPNSRKYRALITTHLGSAMIGPRLGEIDQIAGALLDEWKSVEINVTEICQLLISRVINRFLLGLDETDSLAIGEAIIAGNRYIQEKMSGSGDQEKFLPHATKLHAVIVKALNNRTPFLDALKASDLTLIQMKALLIAIYFTGFGSTISQMSALIWYLAKNPQYQEDLFQEVAKGGEAHPFTDLLIKESFRIHPSTLTIDRPVARPLKLTYDYGDIHQEIYIPEKSIISQFQPWSGERCENPKIFNPYRKDPVDVLPWGKGVHACVGKFVAEQIMIRFMHQFTRRFISSSPEENLEVQGFFTLDPKDHVKVKGECRS